MKSISSKFSKHCFLSALTAASIWETLRDGKGRASLRPGISSSETITAPYILTLSFLSILCRDELRFSLNSSAPLPLGNLSMRRIFPMRSLAAIMQPLSLIMSERTFPARTSISRMVAGRPDSLIFFPLSLISPSFIRESTISEIDTLFMSSSLESSALLMSLPPLMAESVLSLFIWRALSGLEKSISRE